MKSRARFASAAVIVLGVLAGLQVQAGGARPRARDLGLAPGVFPPGPLDAITDVAGVQVGHVTLIEGERVRTGVTVVVPHPGNVFRDKVPAAVFVGHGFGKLAGSTQVDELGVLETPVALTNTLAVGPVMEGLVAATLANPENAGVRSVNAVVGETNDGSLNEIAGGHVRPEHVRQALQAARGGAVDEGNVGAGAGTRCFGWKCGIGTASRVLPAGHGGFTLGVLVQANFGGVLTLDGVPVGKELGRHEWAQHGSCMIVVATDAPLDARDLRRLAARAVYGLARTGSSYGNGSGDYAIAFSTAPHLRVRYGDRAVTPRPLLPAEGTSPLFQAALEATEEAVYNALLRSETLVGNGTTAEAIPIDRVRELLRKYGRSAVPWGPGGEAAQRR